ncbi:hypothetical protein ACS0TY_012583 [Phlomoides rotata]
MWDKLACLNPMWDKLIGLHVAYMGLIRIIRFLKALTRSLTLHAGHRLLYHRTLCCGRQARCVAVAVTALPTAIPTAIPLHQIVHRASPPELLRRSTALASTSEDSLKRESGSKVHHANIQASKAVADIVRTTLGPRSMLKMLLDASGGIVVTNDGNAILRELDVAHPVAKSMIELSRTQDEEVGDGTTSVIVLGEGQRSSSSTKQIRYV